MSKIKLDLSQFKHVKSDKDTTTLQHKQGGHMLTMVHSALSPENQQQLSALSKISKDAQTPLEKDEVAHKMKDGGLAGLEKPFKGDNSDSNASSDKGHSYYSVPATDDAKWAAAQQKLKEYGEADKADQTKRAAQKPVAGESYAKGGGVKKPSTAEKLRDTPPSEHGRTIVSEEHQPKTEGGVKVIDNEPINKIGKLKVKMADGGKVAKYCSYCGRRSHDGECESEEPQKMAEGGLPGVNVDLSQQEPQDQAAIPTALSPNYDPSKVDVSADDQNYALHAPSGPNFPKESAKVFQNTNPKEFQAAEKGQAQAAEQSQEAVKRGEEQGMQPAVNSAEVNADLQTKENADRLLPQVQQAQRQEAIRSGTEAPRSPDDFYHLHDAEDRAWQQDLQNGHIQPQTYAGMFANQDTLGKLGTIFGMLAGGIGSGLTKQPNMFVQMMDNVIKQDFEAQKQSKENAINFLRLQQNHDMNQAQIKHLALADQQTTMDLAQMKAGRTFMAKQWNEIQKMPDGPAKQNAMQAFGILSQTVDAKYQDIKASMAAKQSFLQGAMTGAVPQANSEQKFGQTNQALRYAGLDKMANEKEEHHLIGSSQPTVSKVDPKDRDVLEANQRAQDLVKEALNFKVTNPGAAWDVKQREKAQTLMSNIGDAIRASTGAGVFKQSELENIKNQIGDTPAAFFSFLKTDPKLQQTLKKIQGDRLGTYKKYGVTPDPEVPNALLQNKQFSFKPAGK